MKKFGRAFNHLEDLIFFYGSAGVKEAVQHITEISNDPSLVRMKWDGGLQVYWGREYVNGPLIMTGHNGWARGCKSTTSEELYDFIINHSGKDRENVSGQRKEFARKFGRLFPLIDSATPNDFVGFVYTDLLFWDKPLLCNDEYNFQPNHTGYTVHKDSSLGKRIEKSRILMAGHAYFDTFGLNDEFQKPLDDFHIFNSTDELIILDPYYSNANTLHRFNTSDLEYINSRTVNIDRFLRPIDGVSAFKDYIYKYNNYRMKQDASVSFLTWITSISNISPSQILKIQNRIFTENDGYHALFDLLGYIKSVKNSMIHRMDLHATEYDVKAFNPEGWVRYADETKQFGHIKLVPRHKWTP